MGPCLARDGVPLRRHERSAVWASSARSLVAAYDADGRFRWLRQPNVFPNNAVTIGRDGAFYYLNILIPSATDFDPGPDLDVKDGSRTTCYITKSSPP